MTIQLSNRIQNIKPSPTLSISQTAAKLKAEGVQIISLSSGEPDFAPPQEIIGHAAKALASGPHGYTPVPGLPELRQAIRNDIFKKHTIEYDVDDISVSCGAKQSIFNALMCILNEGDEVIILSPYWVSYPDMVSIAGGQSVIVETDAGNKFQPNAFDIQEAITDKTKAIIVNSPNNPTGAVYQQSFYEDLAAILQKHPDILLISDDIYASIRYHDTDFCNLMDVAPALRNQFLLVAGLSKSHAMTGWRLGYAAGPTPLIKAMNKLQSQSTTHTARLSQMAAIKAYELPENIIDPFIEQFAKRQETLCACVHAIDGLSIKPADGAFYLYIDCQGWIGKKMPDGTIIENDGDAATFLLNYANIAVVPGIAFGLSPYFRVSYAASDDDIAQACAQLTKAAALLE